MRAWVSFIRNGIVNECEVFEAWDLEAQRFLYEGEKDLGKTSILISIVDGKPIAVVVKVNSLTKAILDRYPNQAEFFLSSEQLDQK